MAITTFALQVHYEDGTDESVVTDQRDFAMWEVQEFGRPMVDAMQATPHLFMRWCAWHALHRQKAVKAPWSDWNGSVMEVEPLDDEPVSPDPGEPTATEEP